MLLEHSEPLRQNCPSRNDQIATRQKMTKSNSSAASQDASLPTLLKCQVISKPTAQTVEITTFIKEERGLEGLGLHESLKGVSTPETKMYKFNKSCLPTGRKFWTVGSGIN